MCSHEASDGECGLTMEERMRDHPCEAPVEPPVEGVLYQFRQPPEVGHALERLVRMPWEAHRHYSGSAGGFAWVACVEQAEGLGIELTWEDGDESLKCHDLGGTGAYGEPVFACSACGCVMSLEHADGAPTVCTSRVVDLPRVCPECGRRITSFVARDASDSERF